MQTSKPRARLAAVFVAVFLINALLMPAQFLPGDPLVWFSEAESIVYRGELALRDGAVPYGSPGQYVVTNTRNGLSYSKYGVMSSIAVIPAVIGGAILDESGPTPILATNLWYAFVSAGLAVMIFQLAGRYTKSVVAQLVFVGGCFYCSFLWYYLRAQSMELFISVYATGWYLAMTGRGESVSRGNGRRVAVSWLMIALLVHTRPMFIMLAGLTAVWIGWDLLRRRAPLRRMLTYAVLPVTAVGASLLVMNHIRFGAWYYSGYHQWNPEEHTASLSNLTSIFGFVGDPQYSIFLTFPVLLLSLFVAKRFWRKHRAHYVLALIVLAGAMLFYGLFANWRGDWAAGPRYVLFALIPASIPCVLLLDEILQNLHSLKRRLALAAVALLLLGSCFCWYQVIARGMFAFHTAVLGLERYGSFAVLREYRLMPRGLVMYRMDRPAGAFDSQPLLVQASRAMSAEEYARYRSAVYSQLQPSNFWLLQTLARQEASPQGVVPE